MPMHTLIPKDVLKEMDWEFGAAGLDNADNYRAYRRKDRLLFDEFNEASKGGCCGSYESSIIDDNHDTWIVGCNYGH